MRLSFLHATGAYLFDSDLGLGRYGIIIFNYIILAYKPVLYCKVPFGRKDFFFKDFRIK